MVFAAIATAQPVISEATHTASYLDPALPNGGLAQGGMFTLFGTDLGPGAVAVAN